MIFFSKKAKAPLCDTTAPSTILPGEPVYVFNVNSQFEYFNSLTSEEKGFDYSSRFSDLKAARNFSNSIIMQRHAIELAEDESTATQEFSFNYLPAPWVEISKSVSISRRRI